MTDQITDQELRDAIEWGRCNEYSGDPAEANAAIVILATVDAPAPTLAEELREVADNYGMSSRAADRLHDIADRVEHDLAEARAELERERDLGVALAHERDDARAKVCQMEAARETNERMYREARAEVERLTAERDTEVPDDNDWLAGMKEAARYAINATRPDPAEAKPGEAWKANIWYDGVHQPGTAIKSAGSSDWVVIRDDGSRSTFRMNEYVELVSRLVPAPRVITNPDELDALPDDTIVRIDEGGDAMRKYKGKWHPTSNECCYESRHIALPATVLWEPEA